MELTEEQKERIRRNREAALELRAKRMKGDEGSKRTEDSAGNGLSNQESPMKRQKMKDDEVVSASNDNEIEVKLEPFEEGASEYVTKQEAMKMYCLPAGTLEVCSSIEKPNPRNKAWSSMKLYHRSEIRRRAHLRYGGLDGLVAERQKRQEDRFQKDMENAKDLFR
jgi:XPA protein C-terminus